jgi:hypothetical protein
MNCVMFIVFYPLPPLRINGFVFGGQHAMLFTNRIFRVYFRDQHVDKKRGTANRRQNDGS